MRHFKLFLIILLVALFACAAPVMAATEEAPAGIDWSPVTTAIVALIATLVTTFIPEAIKLFFEAQSARLAKVKALGEQYQDVADKLVRVIQQTGNALTNSAKYALALHTLDAELHLPENTLRQLIEDAVASAKLAWGDEWNALGGKPVSKIVETAQKTESQS